MPAPFDPDASAAKDAGVFGLACAPSESAIHLLPVPFDATVSYGVGAARGPEAILAASHQVELYDVTTGRPYQVRLPDGRVADLGPWLTQQLQADVH